MARGDSKRRAHGFVRKRPSLRMLADRPLKDAPSDYLGFDKYAEALAELIDNEETATPLTMSISAPWGAGKTSLAELLEQRLRERARERRSRAPVTVWFNAWRHDDAHHLGAAFAADVARTASRCRSIWLRMLLPLPDAMLGPYERWRRRILLGVLVVAGAFALAMLVPGLRELLVPASFDKRVQDSFSDKAAAVFVVAAALVALAGKATGFGRSMGRFVGDPRNEAARGAMDEVSKQLGSLLKQASRGRRIVIFVDDLERCRPPRAVEVCEVASQLLAHPNVVTVILADMEVIAASAEIKYASLEHTPDTSLSTGAYGRLYLHKLVQIEFTLPPADVRDLRELLKKEGVPRTVEDSEAEVVDQAGSSAQSWVPSDYAVQVGMVALAPASAFIVLAYMGVLGGPLTQAEIVSWVPIGANLLVAGLVGARFVALIPPAIGRLRVRRAERKLRDVIARIKSETNDPVEIERRVLDTPEATKRPGLASQLLQRELVDDSELRQQAEREILAFLPPYPRSAKRMLNHLRVLLVVASLREMLGGNPPLTAAHLGKWVVLTERWPELARALKKSPEKLSDVETADSSEDLDFALAGAGLPRIASDDLHRFLVEDPRLGDVLGRLVHLAPATDREQLAAASA